MQETDIKLMGAGLAILTLSVIASVFYSTQYFVYGLGTWIIGITAFTFYFYRQSFLVKLPILTDIRFWAVSLLLIPIFYLVTAMIQYYNTNSSSLLFILFSIPVALLLVIWITILSGGGFALWLFQLGLVKDQSLKSPLTFLYWCLVLCTIALVTFGKIPRQFVLYLSAFAILLLIVAFSGFHFYGSLGLFQ